MIYKVFILLLFSTSAQAITIVSDFSTKDSDVGRTSQLGLSYSGAGGNSDYSSGSINLTSLQNDIYSFSLNKLSYNYGVSSGKKNINNMLYHYRYGMKVSEFYQNELYVQYQSDEFSKLEYRYLLGVGSAFIIDDGDFETRNGFGVFYEYSKEDSYILPAWRFNLYSSIKINFADEKTFFSNIVYYQPKVVDLSDSKVLNVLSVGTALFGDYLVKLSLKYGYDSSPAIGVESVDVTYKTSILFDF